MVNLEALDRDGFAALPGVLSATQVAAALARVEELLRGQPAQGGTLHLGGLAQDPAFEPARSHTGVLAAIGHILGVVRLREVSYRAPLPGHGWQGLHADWSGPPEAGRYQVASAIVALAAFTEVGGSTRVIAGSHRRRSVPKADDPRRRHPGERRLIGPAGTAFVFNGHVWHSGTRNDGAAPRHALVLSFSRI